MIHRCCSNQLPTIVAKLNTAKHLLIHKVNCCFTNIKLVVIGRCIMDDIPCLLCLIICMEVSLF